MWGKITDKSASPWARQAYEMWCLPWWLLSQVFRTGLCLCVFAGWGLNAALNMWDDTR